jgi:hypothetical protein
MLPLALSYSDERCRRRLLPGPEAREEPPLLDPPLSLPSLEIGATGVGAAAPPLEARACELRLRRGG